MGRKKTTITTIQIAEPLIEENDGEAIAASSAGTVLEKDPITIKKARIKDDLFLDVEYSEETKDGKNDVTKSCTAPVHDDLKAAFKNLSVHLCRISEQYDSLGNYDSMHVTCKGFTIGGKAENEGVTLSGYRILESDLYFNINSPFIKWSNDYAYISELSQIIEDCKHEVKLYLFEGKHQPDAQQELPFDTGYAEEAL